MASEEAKVRKPMIGRIRKVDTDAVDLKRALESAIKTADDLYKRLSDIERNAQTSTFFGKTGAKLREDINSFKTKKQTLADSINKIERETEAVRKRVDKNYRSIKVINETSR